jgi:hypothetical protein
MVIAGGAALLWRTGSLYVAAGPAEGKAPRRRGFERPDPFC